MKLSYEAGVYVKDSLIEKQIEQDLEKERLKGMIEEVEYELSLLPCGSSQRSSLEERLEKLREDLKPLSN